MAMNVQKKNLIVLSCAEEKKENDANFMKKIPHHWLDGISLGFILVMGSKLTNEMEQWIVTLELELLVL